uniref:Uncharacterized protein n=1 Tax=viral metagenome TaxID=1070528 RepID=A0A6M3X8C4_9ZZZZ
MMHKLLAILLLTGCEIPNPAAVLDAEPVVDSQPSQPALSCQYRAEHPTDKTCDWHSTYVGGNWRINYNCYVRSCNENWGVIGCHMENDKCGVWTWSVDGHVCTTQHPPCPKAFYSTEELPPPPELVTYP